MKKSVFFFCLLTLTTFLAGVLLDFNQKQLIAWTVFSMCVWATLLFWSFRVPIAFLGTSFLLLSGTLDLKHFVEFASLDVIFFLIGMMILMAALEEVKFFDFVITRFLSMGRFTARKFVISVCFLSAIFACLVDEVTSIIFIATIVINVCKKFNVSSVPYVIISVLATNIGSCGTMLGNPIGILIGTKASLTFEDFIIHAFPLMVLSLITAIPVVLFWFRREIRQFDEKIKEVINNKEIRNMVEITTNKGLIPSAIIFLCTLALIAMHHRLELALGLQTNTLIVAIPVLSAGVIMLWHKEKAKKYLKENVDWWTLIFFMLLFAKAGTLGYTGIADVFAAKIIGSVPEKNLLATILWTSAIGSSLLDNVVMVVAYIPVIFSLSDIGVDVSNLWWALLFGGCLGGNITMVGSTANIVALGMLEERENYLMPFLRWLGVGLTTGIITITVAWIGLTVSGG